jgi:hypothetical protein
VSQDRGIDVLISAFVHYSELSVVKYEGHRDILKIEVLLNAKVEDDILEKFIASVKQCLKLYFNLSHTQPGLVEINYSRSADITLLKICRDAQSLSKNEIELLISLLREQFNSILVREQNSKISDASFERQIKRSILQAERNATTSKSTLFAYRDEGTMFVFNK